MTISSKTVSRVARLFTDGACRGNPGPAATGVALFNPNNKPIAHFCSYLGHRTNNIAEYQACLQGILLAHTLQLSHLIVFSDSRLLVEQISGRYAVRTPTLQHFHKSILQVSQSFDSIQFQFLPRQQNHLADALANDAINSQNPFHLQLFDTTHPNRSNLIQQIQSATMSSNL